MFAASQSPSSTVGPAWHPNLTSWSRVPVAQLRYDPASHTWTLYWADRNSRRYDDVDPGTADERLNEINDGPTCIVWGLCTESRGIAC
jgi:Protein of unknown function (DUF3024)